MSPQQCDRNLPVCNHCTENNQTDCNYTPKKRHKVPNDHGPVGNRPVAPYASKTAAFLVNEQPDEDSPKNGSPVGPSAGPALEGEPRAEHQIKQYAPPFPPPLGGGTPGVEDTPMEIDPEGTFQHRAPDGSFAWVRPVEPTRLREAPLTLTLSSTATTTTTTIAAAAGATAIAIATAIAPATNSPSKG